MSKVELSELLEWAEVLIRDELSWNAQANKWLAAYEAFSKDQIEEKPQRNLLNQAIEECWRNLVTCKKCSKEMFVLCPVCERHELSRIASIIKVPSEQTTAQSKEAES